MNEDRAYREQGTAAYLKLRIPFDYSNLKKEIAKQYKTRRAFARAMGLPENSVYRKLNGKAYWKQREIVAASMLLDIPFYLMPAYFFNVDTKCKKEARHDP
jgi:hypothetical protein